MSQYWFVDRDANGKALHLLRLTSTDDFVRAEALRDGAWHEDSAVLGWLFDRGMQGALDEQAGWAVAVEMGINPEGLF